MHFKCIIKNMTKNTYCYCDISLLTTNAMGLTKTLIKYFYRRKKRKVFYFHVKLYYLFNSMLSNSQSNICDLVFHRTNNINGEMCTYRLLYCGIIIHIIFLISIFDIYFKSPIISGITPEPNPLIPLGKRVVLISVDGLRADSLFDKDPITGKPVAEYMQNIIKTRGTWGVSQSRVPTESRPGHVAMLAGFYEDPSAVTKGWKENPVNFDSIFNRSHCFFAWGSPDILHIFFKGLKHDCAFMKSYENEQNFAGDSKLYDNWVFDEFHKFIKFSKNRLSLHEEGIFFFLHLLGQDTSGHTDKPHTEKYWENLKNVDKLVEKIENILYDFYGDDRTTFIFTSDHGMTDWGAHGAGSSDETKTPIVAWGAGIRKAGPSGQIDINQADITPLLAILLGCPIPVNSVGVLPIAYLNMSKKQIAEGIFLNAKQMVAQYLKLFQNIEETIISLFHVPYKKLSSQDIALKFSSIKDAIKSEKYSEAILFSKNLIESGLEGLNYYHNYYQKPLLYCISLSYIAWVFYLFLELLSSEHARKYQTSISLNLLFCFGIIATVILVAIQKLPVLFYAYTLLPEILWYITIRKTLKMKYAFGTIEKIKCLTYVLPILLVVEILVLSFFFRWCLCISILIILFWSVAFINFKSHKYLLWLWVFSGCALGFFSLLPVVGGQPNPSMTFTAGVSLCFLSFISFWFLKCNSIFTFAIRFISLIFSVWNNYVVHSNFNKNQGVLDFHRYISWVLLTFSLGLLFTGRVSVLEKLYQIFLSLSIPFFLLTIKQEGFFLLFLYIHLFCWIHIEAFSNKNSVFSQFRIAYFFMVYIFLSFFGLGNISSLNSFDPAWVRCFVTVFSPFLMAALIIMKTTIPFIAVACTFRIITSMLKIQPRKLFIIVLIYCNIMGLNFLFLVRNKGSWLDIGTSISHYVIQQVTTVCLVLLFGIAMLLIKNNSTSKDINKEYESIINLSNGSKTEFSLPTLYYSKQHKT